MLNFIDGFLNRITMYRLVLYYLLALLGAAAVFGYIGLLPFSPAALLYSTVVILAASLIVNAVFGKVFKAQRNVESAYITAFILALIITPVAPGNFSGLAFLIWAPVLAMASKYILAIGKKHVFNPAALAVAVTAFTINQSASWWVGGNLPLLAFVVVGGLLVIRKIQRFDLVLSFFAAAFVSLSLTAPVQTGPFINIWKSLIHSPIFFLAFVMLTEPLTTPPTRTLRIFYGALVGLLFAPNIHFGSVYSTPELTLVVGNIYSYLVSPKTKLILKLKRKETSASGICDFIFEPPQPFRFRPGQYLEWTLGHKKTDSRGNRRYFTIASSPTERELRIGVKFYEKPSSFKKSLLALGNDEEIVAAGLAGDFVLPRDRKKKMVFIAGGIGITPFRSMVKYLSDKGEPRPITIFYSVNNASEIAYGEIFDEAEARLGIKIIYTLTDTSKTTEDRYSYRGYLNREMIIKEVPDYKERIFYVSGPRSLVVAAQALLKRMDIRKNRVKIDFFPGFA